jgi:hypothetical protein
MTKNEQSLITEKQHKKDIHFPLRSKYTEDRSTSLY